MVSFHNPSIRDFLQIYIWGRPELVRDLLSSAVFFEQIEELAELNSLGQMTSEKRSKISKLGLSWAQAFSRTVDAPACRLLGSTLSYKPILPREDRLGKMLRLAASCQLPSVDDAVVEYWERSSGIFNKSPKRRLLRLVPEAKKHARMALSLKSLLTNWDVDELEDIQDYKDFINVDGLYPDTINETIRGAVRERFGAFLPSHIEEVLDNEDDGPEELSDEIDQLKRIAGELDYKLGRDLSALEERLEELELSDDNEPRQYSGESSLIATDVVSDDELDRLFSGFKDLPPRS